MSDEVNDSQIEMDYLGRDVTQSLRDAENALRDFISSRLSDALGETWLEECGVTSERRDIWLDRKEIEEKRQDAGVVEERLLYYADFYDLKTILQKHWGDLFSEVLGKWKRFEVLFDELARFRDPDAHRRDLLPHQQHLVIGISGEIRSRLVRWRSRRETSEDCFPRIESARDSLGNLWVPNESGKPKYEIHAVDTEMTLRPGDKLDFLVKARDPEDLPVRYRMWVNNRAITDWQPDGAFSIKLTEEHIGRSIPVRLEILSPRDYHAEGNFDDYIHFFYTVLPRKGTKPDFAESHEQH